MAELMKYLDMLTKHGVRKNEFCQVVHDKVEDLYSHIFGH